MPCIDSHQNMSPVDALQVLQGNITSIHLPSENLLVTFRHPEFPLSHLQRSKVAVLCQKLCIFTLRKVSHQTLWLVYKWCTESALLVSYKHLCTCNPVATSDNLLRQYQTDSVSLSTETSKLLILNLNAKTYQLMICKSQWQRCFKMILLKYILQDSPLWFVRQVT